jgi:hypothetical protein
MHGKVPLDPLREDVATRLRLQILVAADVVRVGVRVVDRAQAPAVRVQNLANLAPGVLVVSAVDEADVVSGELDKPDLRGALDVIAAFCDLV